MANPLDLLSSEGLDPSQNVEGLDLLPGGPVGPFKRGLGAGVSGVKANLYGAGALLAKGAGTAAETVGATGLAETAAGLEKSALEQSAVQSEEAAAQSQDLSHVNWADPGSIVNHFKYLLGNAVPSLTLMAAGGVVGRGLGAIAGRALSTPAAASLTRAATFGGAVAPDVALEAGGIYPEALKTGVENPALRAAAGGAAAAAFDFIPLLAAEKYLKPLGKGGFRSLAKGAVKGAPVGAALEGTQEFAQSVVERAAAGLPLTGPEAIHDYINSFAGGAAPGALFGAGIGMHRGSTAKVEPAAPAEPAIAAAVEPGAPVEPVTPTEPVSPLDTALAAQVDLAAAHQAATEQMATFETQIRDSQVRYEATTARLAELTAEAKLPFDQRRAKSVILAERKAVQEQAKALKAATAPLDEQYHAAKQAVETLTPQLEQAAQAASYQQTLATTPAELNPDIAFKEPPPASDIIETTPPILDTTLAETAVAKVKRNLGMLVSSREAKLAPATTPRAQALEVVGSRARETIKSVDEKTRQGAVETAAVQAAQPNIKELVAAKSLKPAGQEKLTVALTNALNEVAKVAAAKPTTEEAQAHIQAEVPKVLKGRVASQDANEVASIMSDAVGQAHTLYSKSANTVAAQDWQRIQQFAIGKFYLTNSATRAITAGPFNTFSAAVDAQAPNTNDQPVRGDQLSPDAVVAFNTETMSNAALSQTEFDTLPEVVQVAVVDTYNEVMTSAGTRLREQLTSLIGDDPNLVVRTFVAKPGEAIGVYTRVDKLKSIIVMALNTKDGLSVADHEGFHYVEDKLLTSAERRIVANAVKEGRPAYEQLMAKVRKYDQDNGTNLADEVSGTPAEARAYAFEFWRRGELQVEGVLNRVFAKLQQFFEKVANLVKGLGFTSMEDIFTALDRSQFAERKRGSRGLKETERGSFSNAAVFYSQLMRSVEAAPDRLFTTGRGFSSWLSANAPKLGIKKDEIFFSGINDWLETQGKVTKADVLAYLAGNGVQVRDVVLERDPRKGLSATQFRNLSEAQKKSLPGHDYADDMTFVVMRRDQPLYLSDQGYGGKPSVAIGQYISILNENESTLAGSPRFNRPDLLLPGGENYRELLLTLPAKTAQQYFIAYKGESTMGSGFASRAEAEAELADTFPNRPDLEVREGRGDRATTDKVPENFHSPHYPDQPSILAHIRFNERVDAEGKRVLFVEEVQSDWGQKGKKEGFAKSLTDSEEARLVELRKQADAYRGQMVKAAKDETDALYEEARTKRLALLEEINRLEKSRSGSIPTAPFVTDTKSWTTLALKKTIAYAVENGFDKIAWTTGEQQAARYDLSKQVAGIRATKNQDGSYALRIKRTPDDLTWEHLKSSVPASDLEEFVGKDLAKKILEDSTGPGAFIKSYSGLDLKVGGEGMKGYYDQIVPQVANDILRKVGGGRVETVSIGDAEASKFSVVLANGKSIKETDFLSNAEGLAAEYEGAVVRRNPTHLGQPGFTITPELQAKVLGEGMSLFSRSAVDSSENGLGRVLRNLTPEQRTAYSQAATNAEAAMDRQMANGELERAQAMEAGARMMQDALEHGSDNMAKIALGSLKTEFSGDLTRWLKKNILTPHFTARFSSGFKNVFNVLNTYSRYRGMLITQLLKEQMPEWYTASKVDQDVTFDALLNRTVNKYEMGSAELTDLLAPLTPEQRTMFDSATRMIEGFLRRELEVDKAMFRRNLTTPGEYEARVAQRTAEVDALIKEGYVPLRRYGDHTVHVYKEIVDAGGKQQQLVAAYQAFPRQATAQAVAKIYQEEIDRTGSGLKVEVGTRHKTARDASISIQQFLDTARRNGVPLTQMERERVVKALSTAESLTRNRMLHREGVPGYSQDGMRVLNEFGVGLSGKIAYAEFASAIDAAADGREVSADVVKSVPTITIDELRGEPGATEAAEEFESRNLWVQEGPMSGFHHNLSDELIDYVLVPDHTGGWSRKLRGAAMVYFIGGSISSALVNVMSVPMMVVPELSIHTNYVNSLATTMAAWKTTWQHQAVLRDIAKLKDKTAFPIPEIDNIEGLREALVTAAEDLRTMDTEIHGIMGMAQGAMYSQSRNVQKAMEVWMTPFRVTEQTNRITSFIAGYKVGKGNGLTGQELYRFAGSIVDNTQNDYSESNRPGAARHPVFALMMMFKSFPLFMVESVVLMYKANPKSAVYMLLGLTMMTGVQGLPFAETIEDLIDMIAQRIFGSPFNSRRAMRNILKDASEAVVGYDLSDLVLRGVINDVFGMSVSSRIGAGDFVPGSRLGTADADQGRVLEQLLGAPYAMVKDVLSNVGNLAGGAVTGDWKQAADALRAGGPIAVRNLIKGTEQFNNGYASDSRGRKLVDVTTIDAMLQLTGVASSGLAKAYEHDKISQQVKSFYVQVGADMQAQLVQAMQADDTDKMREIADFRTSWNEQHPDMPLVANPASIRRALRLSGMALSQRERMKLPRQLRWLADEGSTPEE